jgi:hypothetical protein
MIFAVVTVCAFVFAIGCGDNSNPVDGASYNPVIDPANFVTKVDNQYYPLKPNTTLIYEGKTENGNERIEVKVTDQTKKILGVTCVTVRDTVFADGKMIEDTLDWYTQDKEGNVWYFGEDSKEYKDGIVVSTEGSWEAGVDNAKPGILMKANPQVGNSYRQEYYKGKAEDKAEVISLGESVTVRNGSYKNCLKTKDLTPLKPEDVENKYYAPGVGVILEVMVNNSSDRVELVDIKIQ